MPSESKEFDMLVKSLGKSRLSAEALEAARGDYHLLYLEASKICCSQFQQLCRQHNAVIRLSDMDALQDAIVAAGYALPRWQPERGSLQTFLWPIVQRTVSAYLHAQRTGGIGSTSVNVSLQPLPDESQGDEGEGGEDNNFAGGTGPMPDALVYEDDIVSLIHNDRLHTYAKDMLPRDDYNLLAMRLGLCGPQLSVYDIAKTLSVHRKTISRRLYLIKKCLMEALE